MDSPLSPDQPTSHWLKADAPAGLVVFLVALPLCLGIALASEAPLMSGIVAGVVGGLVVAVISKSQLSVTGPAAGLATIVAAGALKLGSFEALCVAVFLAGIFQIVLGIVRAGFLAELFPLSVIKGMLAAIGIILILKQIPHALGHDDDYEGDLGFWVPGGEENTFTEIIKSVQTASPGVILVTATCMAILLFWQTDIIKKQSWSRIIPGPLVAVLAGVVINMVYAAAIPEWHITAAAGHLVELPEFDGVMGLYDALPRPAWGRIGDPAVWGLALTIGAVASIETLLCVEATDKLDPYKRVTPTNRELIAQGVGNSVSGFLGGLPVTAVIVRSSANVQSGGRTWRSAFIHGILLFGLVVAVPHLLNKIPLASLAAILLMVGYKLARIPLFMKMWNDGLDQFLPFVVTIVTTVFTDLLMGVGAGFVVGLVMVFLTNFHSAIRSLEKDGVHYVVFEKDVSFLNKARLKKILSSIPRGATVRLDGRRAVFIDHDILEVVEDFMEGAEFRDLNVESMDLVSKDHPITTIGRKASQTPLEAIESATGTDGAFPATEDGFAPEPVEPE